MRSVADKLIAWLERDAGKARHTLSPLPPTRQLGERFGVANSTVYRLFDQLCREGRLWQAPNGRYYHAFQRSLVEKKRPVVCLIRRLENISIVYRQIIEGLSEACSRENLPLWLMTSDVLVAHHRPEDSPVFASTAAQLEEIERLLQPVDDPQSRIILDHLWSDSVVERIHRRFPNSVQLYRPSPHIASSACDFSDGAQKALAHLFARGFTKIIPVEPFSGDPGIEAQLTAFEQTATLLAARHRITPRHPAHNPTTRTALLEKLIASPEPTALFCPEDHTSCLLGREYSLMNRSPRKPLPILSGQGTELTSLDSLSSLAFPFRQMGYNALNSSSLFPASLIIRQGID